MAAAWPNLIILLSVIVIIGILYILTRPVIKNMDEEMFPETKEHRRSL